jgi:penicillin-binding protein 2
VNLYEAIEQSCNVYFWNIGLKVGLDQWSRYAKLLHFGKKTGIDLPLENSGNLPDKEYLDHQYGEGKWTDGLLLNLSVGQGDLVVTSLQMLQLVSIIAKRGVLIEPHLLYYTHNPLNDHMEYFKPDSFLIPEISDSAYQVVREGMRRVIHGQNGTGKAASVPNVTVAGKTGTAQNPHGDNHAWFVGFAPFDYPTVAIVVLVENGGGGSAVAAPIAGKLLRFYFKNREPRQLNQIIAQKSSAY